MNAKPVEQAIGSGRQSGSMPGKSKHSCDENDSRGAQGTQRPQRWPYYSRTLIWVESCSPRAMAARRRRVPVSPRRFHHTRPELPIIVRRETQATLAGLPAGAEQAFWPCVVRHVTGHIGAQNACSAPAGRPAKVACVSRANDDRQLRPRVMDLRGDTGTLLRRAAIALGEQDSTPDQCS